MRHTTACRSRRKCSFRAQYETGARESKPVCGRGCRQGSTRAGDQDSRKPHEHPHAVIGLRDAFRPIPQADISYQKVITSTRQIQRMDTENPAGREFSCNCIEGSVPALSVDRHTSCREPVDGSKRKTLCLSIVPPESCKHADIARDLLLSVHSESVLERPVAPRRCYVRRSAAHRSWPTG